LILEETLGCRLKALVLANLEKNESPHAYTHALDDFLSWSQRSSYGALSRAKVQRYRLDLQREELPPATINARLSAVRRLALEAANSEILPLDVANAIARIHDVKKVRQTNNQETL
jgi:site-specific recombinase XerD